MATKREREERKGTRRRFRGPQSVPEANVRGNFDFAGAGKRKTKRGQNFAAGAPRYERLTEGRA